MNEINKKEVESKKNKILELSEEIAKILWTLSPHMRVIISYDRADIVEDSAGRPFIVESD